MSDMEQFFTQDRANEGVKVPLHTPDGAPTDHYLIVRGMDSDAYQEAKVQYRMELHLAMALQDKPEERNRALLRAETKLAASLVAGWSFEDECTPGNVLRFLMKAPQIADRVDLIAGERWRFFGERRDDSETSPEPNSA